jgi:hypothetical protein
MKAVVIAEIWLRCAVQQFDGAGPAQGLKPTAHLGPGLFRRITIAVEDGRQGVALKRTL